MTLKQKMNFNKWVRMNRKHDRALREDCMQSCKGWSLSDSKWCAHNEFIWGIKSCTDHSMSQPSFDTLNDCQVYFNHKTGTYFFEVFVTDTMGNDQNTKNYFDHIYNEFKEFIGHNVDVSQGIPVLEAKDLDALFANVTTFYQIKA